MKRSRALYAALVTMLAALLAGCEDDAEPKTPDASVNDASTMDSGSDVRADASASGCNPDAAEARCAYGMPGYRCSDSNWPAVCRDGLWRCEAFQGYPGGIPVNQCSDFGAPPQVPDAGNGDGGSGD